VNQVAIVTAAGKGIGAACARRLAADGWKLGLMSRSDTAEALAKELGGVAVAGDATDGAALDRLIGATVDTWGRIDGAVLSTGHAGHSLKPTGTGYDKDFAGNLLDIPDQAWHAALDLYVLNVVRAARALTPVMTRAGGGSIVAISAFGAAEPHAAYPLSSALRRSLSAFTSLYADRYARDRIRMNNLLPGFMDNFTWDQPVIDAIPMGRAGRMDELAATAAFLLGPGAGYITGQDILVDGGMARRL
jgi:NAD(P)-dependent dehydrogenase (short-subunit alcohol dehydrogenase family)